jgi:hypothetical protein
MPRQISSRTTLENLKTEAKRWLKELRTHDAAARERFRRAFPNGPAAPTLREVQHALASEFGLRGWSELKDRLTPEPPQRRYDAVAGALVKAYATGDPESMWTVWDYFGHMRAWAAMRRYVRLDLGRTEEPQDTSDDGITLDEARYLVARAQGFDSWSALVQFAGSVPAGKRSIAAKAIAAYTVDDQGARQEISRSHDWDEIFELIGERRASGLHASGQMTDALLERLSRFDHITSLDLDGSRAVTDEGLRYLAGLRGLRHLDLTSCGVSDAGLDVLGQLPELQSVRLAWTATTDAGALHLSGCSKLRAVDLSGTSSGDGAIRALAGKRGLHELMSGNEVTDAGLALLHELPVFKTWQGGEAKMALLGFKAAPNFLMLRGPFTDAGLRRLVGLDGLFGLNVDSDRLAITGRGLAPLVNLPHLGFLAFDAKDESMPYIAALPHLRFLMCQDTTAGDEGFVALSRSRSIEYIWGRRCHNLQRRGFTALADMPSLRALSVSCKNVDDVGISALPRFPALRELMPMDVPDKGYRHIGQCHALESLVLMYCRETTDAATEHIVSLPALTKYFASYNRITDRTPEILSGMPAFEDITFDSCAGLTNAGIAMLARLPRLRRLRVESMPKVTADVVSAFGSGVEVKYSV